MRSLILGCALCSLACGTSRSTSTTASAATGTTGSATSSGPTTTTISTASTTTTAGSSGTTAAGTATSSSSSSSSSSTSGGCSTTLPDGGLPATPTWCNYAQAFIDAYCLDCHAPGGQGAPFDLSSYQGVYDAGGLILCGTCVSQQASWNCGSFPPARQFPIAAPYPSDAERNEMVLWLTSGAPQN